MSSVGADIEVVFWDFGGVFTPSPFGSAASAFATERGIEPRVLEDLVLGYHTPDGDHPWHRVERGEIPLHEAFGELHANLEDSGHEGVHLQDFFKSMSASTGLDRPASARPEVVAVVEELRADHGVRHAIITNNVKEFAGGWRSMLNMDLFEEVIDSSAEGIRKPDPAIYHLALERMGGPPPERTVFLDDFAPNLESAAELGLHTILVTEDPQPALDTLRALVSNS